MLLPALWILLAFLVGGATAAAVLRALPARAGNALLSVGAAFPLGVLLLGNSLWLMGNMEIRAAVTWCSVLAMLALGLLYVVRRRGLRGTGRLPGSGHAADAIPLWAVSLAWAVMASAALAIVLNILSLPILTWDAWNAWLARSKGWFHLEAYTPVLPIAEWFKVEATTAISAVAPNYPQGIARWVAALAWLHGTWHDPLVALPWALLWVSLGFLLAGALISEGAGCRLAVCASAALLTLPMVLSHASLAGYMDLWLATAALLAVVLGQSWLKTRRVQVLSAFLLVVAVLPTVKLEGSIYALLILAAILPWALPASARKGLALVCLLLLGVWWVWGVAVPLPGLGWARISRELISLPLFGDLQLAWRPVGQAVLEALFLLPNWSLLWYLAAPLLWWGRTACRERPAPLLFLALSACFHFLLFFFTPASTWAEDLTSLNRLILHAVPVWVWVLACGFISGPAPYGRHSR
jgi:hypothetical protein